MQVGYLLLFLSLSLNAQVNPKIKVIPNPESFEDFEHQNRGCPENSECDQVMGHQLSNWKKLVSQIQDQSLEGKKKADLLEGFRSKYGIPVEFYTTKKSQQGFKPLYFNSQCKHHNLKPEEAKILKGKAFIKSLSKEQAVVWRDQAQIEVPKGELLVAQPVEVYFPDGVQTYYLPIEDQPLFIQKKSLYVLKEEDGLFYALRISPSGEWKIEDLDFKKLSQWEEKKQNVECPKNEKSSNPIFEVAFCKTVWVEDLNQSVIVKMHQGCSI